MSTLVYMCHLLYTACGGEEVDSVKRRRYEDRLDRHHPHLVTDVVILVIYLIPVDPMLHFKKLRYIYM